VQWYKEELIKAKEAAKGTEMRYEEWWREL